MTIPTMTEPDVSKLISVEQAMAIIDAADVARRAERIPLAQSLGLYLAEDLHNDRDAPPFDKSLMDGYAVRARDIATVPRELDVVDRIAAGGVATSPLAQGQAMAIMTGAPVPPSADAVVPVEQTQAIPGSNRIVVLQAASPGQYIAARGSDCPAHSLVLKSGTRLGPAQIAVAAGIGAANIPVFAPPSVAVLGTGDELVAPQQTPAATQIRSCNNSLLLALLQRYPTRPTDLGIVPDDAAAIEAKIIAGLAHDVLLITGGMSMGERDFVPGILRRLRGDLKITKLRIKPGKPFVFAQMPGGKFVFGLPGNPVSAFVCTVCLVSRLVNRMAGGPAAEPARMAPLAKPLEANGPRTFYQPAIFDGRALVPLQWKGSADIFTLSQANSLLVRPENQPPQPAGVAIEFIEI
jgi:molybdopterin molybdotransferase